MKPEEFIQLLRTTTVAQIRKQVEKDLKENNDRYGHVVSFILAAREG
jgi:hypothetical protein